MVQNWVFEDCVRPFLAMLAWSYGGSFDPDDWVAVSYGLENTDAERERWFDYEVRGARGTARFELARDRGTSVVFVRVHEPQSAEGLGMLIAVCQHYRIGAASDVPRRNAGNADWRPIDSQNDLDDLDRQVCWDDSSTIEYYAKTTVEPYFPADVANSGYGYGGRHIHVLCEVCAQQAPYLELVLIGCDWYYYASLEHLHLGGRVDTLKRVDIRDANGSSILRCARLIYRFIEADSVTLPYFRQSGSVSRG